MSRIAVIGMAGRFPGARDLDAYWSNLEGGVESLTTFTDAELEAAGFPRAMLADPRCVKTAPSLGHIDRFDADFFGYGTREAERIDPQQRLLLECAYEALEHAGCVPSRFEGRIGVYVGVGSSGYLEPVMRGINVVTELETVLGNDKDYAATRLSYKLDLNGPSVAVQTACSTSLVAIHLACEALLSGACDVALAGGAKVRIPQAAAYLYQEGSLLSPDGRCRAFDAAAAGTAFGSGAGVVVLKRLEDALRDGDAIDAVILGSAINNDGANKIGYVAPSEDGQAAVIAEALAIAGIDAGTIGYVEAHGTGTALGDPIELAALTRAFRERSTARASCAIGSVKTNIGHLETAAGVAGFIKTVLAMKHRVIPASLNFHQPNPHIDFARTPFRVNAQRAAWTGPRLRAGVSSFGIGGTNAHVVLEGAPVSTAKARAPTRVHVLPVSARSAPALAELTQRFVASLPGARLEDLCASASLRRAHHEHRSCLVGHTADELIAAATAAAGPRRERPRVAFVYSGQGSQWIGMGRALLTEDPAFAARLRECDAAIARAAGFSVLDVLASDDEARWKRVDVVQPLLFAMQVSLSASWAAAGVTPDVVLGHSLGEVAASVVAGSLTLEDGAHVIAARSRLVARTSGRGRMALVELSFADAERTLAQWPGVSIASHHGPQTVLVSGATDRVEALVRALERGGTFSRLVDVDYASHSAQMDPILPELGEVMKDVRGRRADRARQMSTVFAEMIGGEEVGGAYWVRNLREPVRLHDSVERLLADGVTVFLEVSAHPVLAPTLERSLGSRGLVLGTLRRGEDERRAQAESLARLYEHGVDVQWPRSDGPYARLPSYPWQRQRYWLSRAEPRAHGHAWLTRATPHAAQPGVTTWEGELGRAAHLADHNVDGAAVVAAALWVDAALYTRSSRSVEDVELTQLLALGADEIARVQLVAGPAAFEVLTAAPGQDQWTRRARGRFGDVGTPAPAPALQDVKARCPRELDGAALYARLRARGIEHRGRYASVERVWIGDREAIAALGLDHAEPGGWQIEPWWLDAALQILSAAEDPADPRAYLPTRLGRVALHRRPRAGAATVHARWRHDGDRLEGELSAFDADGVWLEAAGIVLRAIGPRRHPVDEHLFTRVWTPRALGPASPAQKVWLILGDGPLSDALVQRLEHHGSRCLRGPRGQVDLEQLPAIHGIVHSRTVDADEPTSVAEIDRAQADGALDVLRLVAALARLALRDPPRLWLVTRGAVAIGGDPPGRVTHAPMWGLARTIAHEHPELRCTCVDLPMEVDAEALARELLTDDTEDQIALRGPRLVARLARARLADAPPELRRPSGDRPFRLELARPGDLDGLTLREIARSSPGPGEVEIEVHATGLNMLDVLIALGVLEDDAPGRAPGELRLGGECAGRVVRVGAGVVDLRPGDLVLAVAHDAFRSFVIATAALTAKVPAGVSAEQAAGFPIAFLSAHLALTRVARLEAGERILIHAASAGVGRAAVQLAQRLGAEVYATAGSEEKRERLRRAGVEVVMSSRSLDFAHQVKALGGVDVVLNSLSGDFIPASLGVLRRHGRFVELGKRDAYEDRNLGLAPFLAGLTFSLFDLRGLLYTRPQVVEAALAELVGALGTGALEPLSTEVFPITEAKEAMRTMAEARHAGKVVLAMRDRGAPIAPRRAPVREDASYLVTGGLGALGLEVAGRLVERGARRVVLMGRSAPSPHATARIAALTRAGATVHIERGDVARPEDVARVIEASPKLAGIVHAAGVLDDGILIRQDAARFAAVMAPKIAGAWNLHRASRDLDFFVMFSSTASLLGAPGQGNYAAASAFLDALAHHRRALGLPALAIQFGPWAEIGLAAAGEHRGQRAAAQGLHGLTPAQGLDAFEALLTTGFIEVGVARLDLRQWLESHPLLAASPLLRDLLDEAKPARARTSVMDALSSAPEGERRAILERHLRQEAASILRVAPERIDPATSLVSLGLSSLTALEYRNRLEVSLGATLPATLVWSHPTTAALTEQVAARLGLSLPQAAPPRTKLAEEIDALSDDQAEQALLDVLAGLEGDL